MRDPYRPPSASLRRRPELLAGFGLRPRAVLVGVVALLAAYVLLTLLLWGLIFGSVPGTGSRADGAVGAAPMLRALSTWRIVVMPLFVLSSGSGGFVAGRIGSPAWRLNSAAVGSIAVILYAAAALPLIAALPPEYWLALLLLIPSALAGGYLGRSRL